MMKQFILFSGAEEEENPPKDVTDLILNQRKFNN
jgi:hypothetical protein